MFTKIKNGQAINKYSVFQKKVFICKNFLNVLWDEGFILGYKSSSTVPDTFEIFLKYQNNKPCIQKIKYLSKPGKRISISVKQLWKLKLNSELIIISTSKGILSIDQCKKFNISGEPFILIC